MSVCKWHFVCVLRICRSRCRKQFLFFSSTADVELHSIHSACPYLELDLWDEEKKTKTKFSNFKCSRFLSRPRMDGRRFYYTQFLPKRHSFYYFESRGALFYSFIAPPAYVALDTCIDSIRCQPLRTRSISR